jgi:DNA polymerase-3 subunit alpha
MLVGLSPSYLAPSNREWHFIEPDEGRPTGTKNETLIKALLLRAGIDYWTCYKTNVLKCKAPDNNVEDARLRVCVDTHFVSELKSVKPDFVIVMGNQTWKSIVSLIEKFPKIKFVGINHVSYCVRGGCSEEEFTSQLDKYKGVITSIRNKSFVNLHHHNEFSIRDGIGNTEDVADRLVELRSHAFCLTNHGNVNSIYRQFKASTERGLKPIFGCEFYYNEHARALVELDQEAKLTPEQKALKKALDKQRHHVTIIAKNDAGYHNLMRLNNQAWIERFYRFPLIDDIALFGHAEGLVVGSGCIGGFIPSHLLSGDFEGARAKALMYKEVFGSDFYIELMSTLYEPQKKANDELVKLARDIGVKVIVTNDCHYINKGDHVIQKTAMLSRDNKTFEDANDPTAKVWTFESTDLFIKTPEDLKSDLEKNLRSENYTDDVLEEAVSNVHDLVSRIELPNIDRKIKLPKIAKNPEQKFKQLVKEGIIRRGLTLDEVAKKRLKLEVQTIISLGFVDYFLILAELITWTKETYGKFSTGVGRGSAAGSYVNYILGITGVNPLVVGEGNLMFERFMSPGRRDLPDIDTDFDSRIKRSVVQHAIELFGRDNVVAIGNYGTNKLKSTIQDVLRVHDAPFGEVTSITKKLHDALEDMSLEAVLEKTPALKELLDKYPGSIKAVTALRGSIRSIGQHAAGICIAGVPVTENLPLIKTSTGELVTANTEGGDYHELTDMGFVKYDILGLTCIDIISDAVELVMKHRGIDLDWDKFETTIDTNAPGMYNLLDTGDTYGIFQFGSKLATNYCKMLSPKNLDDLAAASALLRPGPLDVSAHLSFAKRKHGKEEFTVPECLQDILGRTAGILVYQEQILRICQELGGFTPEEASDFRKALVKYERSVTHEKKRKARVKTYAEKLIKGLKKHMSKEEADLWWKNIEAFVRYGFCAAHAYSYAIQSRREMYLKYYYGPEFWTSLLNSSNRDELLVVVNNMMRHPVRRFDSEGKETDYYLRISLPSLKKRNSTFTLEYDDNNEATVFYGLEHIKGLTENFFNAIATLTAEVFDNAEKLFTAKFENPKKDGKLKFVIDKRCAQALLYSGALDYLGDRSELVKTWNEVRKGSPIGTIKNKRHKMNLEETYNSYSLAKISANAKDRKILLEGLEETLGSSFTTSRSYDIFNDADTTYAVDIGTITKMKSKTSKNGKPYRLLEITCDGEAFYPLICWKNADMESGVNYIYFMSKQRGTTFVNLNNIVPIE